MVIFQEAEEAEEIEEPDIDKAKEELWAIRLAIIHSISVDRNLKFPQNEL